MELLQRFSGVTNLGPYEQLAALRQRGNVDDYIDHFEIIASMIPKESKALYLGFFMNGLGENWVRLWAPENRINAFAIVRNVEVALGKKGGGWHTPRSRVEGGLTEGGHMAYTFVFKNTGNWRPTQTRPFI